ncbi:MAG: zinc ribbon domain-containing protein [Nitrospirae bacterium]|nr:zinc ribbon domain-containing protein [Nitrospirota bacterium]
MPIYEYRCNECGEEFEKLVMGKDAAISCPKCDSKDVTKKLSVFGLSGSEKQAPSGCTSCSKSSCGTRH